MIYRRAYNRFILNDSAYIITQDGSERPLLLKDLSARGAGVFGNYPLGVDEIVKVIISAPLFFDTPISTSARIVWCNKVDINAWEAGLDFGLREDSG